MSDSQKVRETAKFRSKKKIKDITIDKLESDIKKSGVSNIIKILDNFLDRK